MTFSIDENYCELSLNDQEIGTSIFDLEIQNVDTIIGENQKLKIFSLAGEKRIEVLFKPHFALQKLVL